MKLIARLLAGLAVIVALFVASEREAHALGPIDLEAGLKVGVGTSPDSKLPYNPLGFGLGARAGVQLFSLYLGGSAVHYFGGTTSVLGHDVGSDANLLGGEIGYTIGAIPFLQIRPQVGGGDAIIGPKGDSTGNSKGYFYLEPGLTVLIPLGLLYVGADANLLWIPGTDGSLDTKAWTSFTIHGQVGIRI